MICYKCDGGFYGQMLTDGKCESCGKEIYSSYYPCFKLCDECSNKLAECKQCRIFIDRRGNGGKNE